MEVNGLFRKSLFGGFNKKDVEVYLNTLEKEIQGWKQEKDDSSVKELQKSKEENSRLKEELKEIRAQLSELQAMKETELSETQAEKEVDGEKSNSIVDIADMPSSQSYAELKEENISLQQKVKQIEEQYKEVMEDRSLITKVLHDAQSKADSIIEVANIQARDIIEKADEKAKRLLEDAADQADRNVEDVNRELEEKRKIVFDEFRKEIDQRIIDFITTKYKIAEYVKEINIMQGNLEKLSQSMQSMFSEMPAKMSDFLENLQDDYTIPEDKRPSLESSEEI